MKLGLEYLHVRFVRNLTSWCYRGGDAFLAGGTFEKRSEKNYPGNSLYRTARLPLIRSHKSS